MLILKNINVKNQRFIFIFNYFNIIEYIMYSNLISFIFEPKKFHRLECFRS